MIDENLTVTDVVEHAFCPKFTYFQKVLGLKQHEEKRGTVSTGRKFHNKHATTNKEYIPKRIDGKKITEVQFFSKKYEFTGKIDEAIETENEIILIERKYSNNAAIGQTIKVQIGLLSILLEENMKKPVKTAILIFNKSQRTEIELDVSTELKNMGLEELEKTRKIIKEGIEPTSKYDGRCVNCCYRKICIVGCLKRNI